MKRLVCIVVFISSTISIMSQQLINVGGETNSIARFPEQELLDYSLMECIYQYTVDDPVLKSTRTTYEILQVGTKYSKYWDYGYYQIDSVLNHMNRSRITVTEAGNIFNHYPHNDLFSITKNKKKNELMVYGKIFTDGYVYYEPDVTFDWHLTKDTAIICGYSCHQATTEFRGRQWVAWYADITVSEGPWKFAGLPGVILKISSVDNEHDFTAVSIRKRKDKIVYNKYSAAKTTRERFNKALSEYKWNVGKYMSGSQFAPKDVQGKEKKVSYKRLFFNPIEKE